jgi:tripartite-type tricarboxylate transporter receptor subunit TctC
MKVSHFSKFFFILVFLFGLLWGVPSYSIEPNYPTRAIEYVVPWPAGGGTDVGSRVIAKALSKELGVPVNVTNKPGGNQIPGVLSVLTAASNGYTILADGAGSSSLHILVKDLPYKLEERTFIARIMISPQAYIVNGKSSWNSLREMVDVVKRDPGSFTWTWLGGNSTTDFSLLQFFDAAGIDISKTKRVPFQGGGPGVQAVAGGHVLFGGAGAGAMFSLYRSGHIKVLAVTGEKRLVMLPKVPCTKEIGLASLDVMFWVGISGPKGLPKHVVDRLAAAAKKIAEDPQVLKELEAIGAYPSCQSPDEVRTYVLKEADMFKSLAVKVGIAQ